MSFTDTVGSAFRGLGFGQVMDASANLVYDIASINSNDQSWAKDLLTVAADSLGVAATVIPAPLKAAGGFAFNKVAMPIFEASYELGGQVREPLSALALMGGSAARGEGFQAGKAWENREDISLGQSMAYFQSAFDPTKGELRGDFDIFDPNDRKIFADKWEYRTLSGAYDTVATTITDPLGKVGKGLGIARKALVTRGLGAVDVSAAQLGVEVLKFGSARKLTVLSPQTLATRIAEGTEEGNVLYPTLQWFANNKASKINFHPMVVESNDRNSMSWLLGEANTVDDVADTLMAIGLKDTEAMARLVAKRPDLSFVYDKLKPLPSADRMALEGLPTNGIVEDINKLNAATAHLDNLAESDLFYKKTLETLTERGADLSRRTFGATEGLNRLAINKAERVFGKNIEGDLSKYAGFQIFRPTKYHPTVAVVNWATERPAGWINGHDADSINEIYAMGNMLRRLVGAERANPVIARHVQDYISKGDLVEDRLQAAKDFEISASKLLNAKYGMSDEVGAMIWGAFSTRRDSAMSMVRNKKFLMTNDDMILKIPYLERQGGNALPLLDLERYDRALKGNKNILTALEGEGIVANTESGRYIAGILNDTWKASVLMRLGYTIRNTGEASLSIMAKGYGLAWSGELNAEAAKSWYHNRQAGFERFVDKRLVSKGLRTDSIQGRRVLASTNSLLSANNDLLKMAQNWPKAAEIAFQQGKMTEKQYMDFLELSARSDGEQLYHGSPIALDEDALDPTRPFAMTQSRQMSEQYALKGIKVISASEIQRQLTGRAGRLPKNIEFAPGAEISTEGVLNQMPEDEFASIRHWVTGPGVGINEATRESLLNLRTKGEAVFNVGPASMQFMKDLQRTIYRSIVKEEQTVYRGIKSVNTQYENISVGDVIDEPGFSATSKNPELAGRFSTYEESYKPMLFKIVLPKGHAGLDIEDAYLKFAPDYSSIAQREKEILLPPTKFKVLSIEEGGIDSGARVTQGRIVTLQAIKQPTKIKPATKGLNTIAADLKEGLTRSTLKGHQVEVLNPQTGKWHLFDPSNASQKMMLEGQFRIIKPGQYGTQHYNKVYGKQLDLRVIQGGNDHLGLNDFPELKALLGVDGRKWRKGEAWKGKEKELLAWMRENGYGKLILPDNKANGYHTVLTDPLMVETKLNKPTVNIAKAKLTKTFEERANFDIESTLARNPDAGQVQEIRQLAIMLGRKEYPHEGILEAMREIADNHVVLKTRQTEALTNLNARVIDEARLNRPREMQGQKPITVKTYDGRSYEFSGAFQGEPGKIFASGTDAAETYRMMVDHPSQLFQARHGYMTEAHLKPEMPEYFSGWANHLDRFFRSPEGRIDPLIEQFLDGARPEDVVRFLRDPKNLEYRKRFNIDDKGSWAWNQELNVSTSAEDFANNLYSSFQRYFPDEEMRQAFRNGEVDENWLANHFADEPNMPELIGSIVPTSPEAANFGEMAGQARAKIFHFLGSLPETTFARHPLARVVYSSEVKQRGNVALAIKKRNFGEDAELTTSDINAIEIQAREAARREVSRTLFTIVRKSYAGETLRFIMPFFNAWENSVRRWSGFVGENPAVAARMGQITQMIGNSGNMLDKDGNPTNKFSYENTLVLPMPAAVPKAVGLVPFIGGGLKEALKSMGTEVSIPIRSLDIIFQGEAVAGFGPIATIPISELVKSKPNLEDAFSGFLPIGTSQTPLSLGMLVPPAAQKWLSKNNQDEAWSRTFNNVYRSELIRYNLGDRPDEPTLEEIKKKTDAFYTVKMFSNLLLPFAAQYDSPLSFYSKQWRMLQAAHPDDAELIFLEMYPEAAAAMISTSSNPSKMDASQAAYKNFQKHSGLAGEISRDTPDLIGFLVNDPNNRGDFSNAVYQWQYNTPQRPGSNTTLRERRDPSQLKYEADKTIGWYEFNKGLSPLDAQLKNRGLNSFNNPGAYDLKQQKDALIEKLKKQNPYWYADYMDPNTEKWTFRFMSFDKILGNAKWMESNGDRPVVKALATYVYERNQLKRELETRKSYGMPATLSALANYDLDERYNNMVAQLTQESDEFQQFYNRFLQNDPITLG
jgi:hypothetical protein